MLEIPVPVGLLWVHWVSQRCNTYKLVDGIRDKLGNMNTDLGHDVVDQLTFRQREIKVMVTMKDVTEQECHPDLSQSGHASVHDPHPPPCYAMYKIMSRGAKQFTYGLFIKT